ncbi:MAG: hypothetical protein QXT19_04390 [Candidatus Woesearchaeota archaeon]
MTEPNPFTYQGQHAYYRALCDSASELAKNWSDYRRLIAEIRRELRQDPCFKELVENKFKAPEHPLVESQKEDQTSLEPSELESLEAALGFDF